MSSGGSFGQSPQRTLVSTHTGAAFHSKLKTLATTWKGLYCYSLCQMLLVVWLLSYDLDVLSSGESFMDRSERLHSADRHRHRAEFRLRWVLLQLSKRNRRRHRRLGLLTKRRTKGSISTWDYWHRFTPEKTRSDILASQTSEHSLLSCTAPVHSSA